MIEGNVEGHYCLSHITNRHVQAGTTLGPGRRGPCVVNWVPLILFKIAIAALLLHLTDYL